MKQEVYRPIREKGVRMAFLINHQARVVTGQGRAQYQYRLAGKMISMAPSIGTAPIHSRKVGRALVGLECWAEAVMSSECVLEEVH